MFKQSVHDVTTQYHLVLTLRITGTSHPLPPLSHPYFRTRSLSIELTLTYILDVYFPKVCMHMVHFQMLSETLWVYTSRMSSEGISTRNIRSNVYRQFSARGSGSVVYYIYVLHSALESIDFAKYTMLMRVEDIFIFQIDASQRTCIIFMYFYLHIISCANVQIPSN